ncbi:MAG: AAA family ATPase, partial [Nanoarchaeota archaeon]
LMMVAARGFGKTVLAEKVAKALNKPYLYINGATCQKITDFIDNILIPHVVDKTISICLDEVHKINPKVEALLLSILNPTKEGINQVNLMGTDVTFNNRMQTWIAASTNIEKISLPFLDRFRQLHFADYKPSELEKIIRLNTSKVRFNREALKELSCCTRGNPRQCTLFGRDITGYLAVKKDNYFGFDDWKQFKDKMKIFPLGLNESERKYLSYLAELNSATLTHMSAILDMDAQMTRRGIEMFLLKHGLIRIEGKRIITYKGRQILEQCK